MIRRNVILTFLLFSSLLDGGCASIVNGTTQPVSVTTTPDVGAICSLSNDKGEWFVNGTPGTVVVHKSMKDLHVNCNKLGYLPAIKSVPSKVTPMIVGNAIFGLSAVIGGAVDSADGAGFNYPSTIQVPLQHK